MKKGALLFSILFLFLVLNLSTILADDAQKVNEAYTCLLNNVKGKCSTLSTEERIFSMLAIDLCKNETLALKKTPSEDTECWPATLGGACSIKTTAQAIIAMHAAGEDTEKAETWLLNQKKAPPDLTWFLQIESNDETNCRISYNGNSYNTTIKKDKKPSQAAGGCLIINPSYPYWLQIANSDSCLTAKYEISCDKDFLSSFLYKKTGSDTIFVSAQTSTENPTTKQIESFCFKGGDSCDFEGSLWATVVLDYRGYDMTSFKPWLVATTGDSSSRSNQQYLPQAFLWHLLDGQFPEYRAQLLDLRKPSQNKKYWEQVSGNKFYDTALAIYFLDPNEDAVTTAKTWLLSNTGNDKCWGTTNKIRDTAFVLYSAFPSQYVPPEPECSDTKPCIDGYECTENQTCVKAPECRNDTQCSALNIGKNFCLTPENNCVECINNATKGCPEGQNCRNNVCVPIPAECEIDVNCPMEKICNASGKCEPGCRANDEKCALNKFCADTGLCAVGCRNDTVCTGANKACVDHVCVPCRYDPDCGKGKVCTVNNTCVQCLYNTDCSSLGDKFVCNETTNRCFELPDCNPPALNCTEGYQCINKTCHEIPPEPECNQTKHCQTGYKCVNNLCEVEPECNPPSINCTAGYQCESNYCVEIPPANECTYDADCTDKYGPGYECDNTNSCVAKGTSTTCESSGYFCRSAMACNDDGGNLFDESLYSCDGTDRCCDTDIQKQSCSQMNGNICKDNEICSSEGSPVDDATDLRSGEGEICCVGGTCQPKNQLSACQNAGNTCKSSCGSGESQTNDACADSSEVCCAASTGSNCTSDNDCASGEKCVSGVCQAQAQGSSYLWVWILLILIIFVILGILFRNKLTGLFLRMKPRYKKPGPRFGPPPGFPPPSMSSSGPIVRRPMPIMRRILPPQMQRPMPPRPTIQEKPTTPAKAPEKKPDTKKTDEKPKSDLEDVLKKLKDISK